MARIGSIILIMGFVAIKCAALLNNAPVSSIMIIELTVRCTMRNSIRNIPVTLITNFFPIDDTKKLLIVKI
ncbi:MAG: hypothetical protein STSR0006_13730 [Lentimicrobium sp.]